MTKNCKSCLQDKDFSEFQKLKTNKDGYKDHCKNCNSRPSRSKRVRENEIYVLTNPAWPEYVKIGRTKYINNRIRSYQTYTPFRDYKLCYNKKVLNIRDIEKYFIANFESSNEWFKMSKEEAIKVIEKIAI